MPELPVPYFLCRPNGSPPWPGVVVLMEGHGVTPQLLRVSERIAREGYLVATPDLFHELGGPNPERAQEQYTVLGPEDAQRDIGDVVAQLRNLGASRIGVTGFCMGGSFTYMTATSGIDIQAAVAFYGAGIGSRLGTPTCPFLLLYGGSDEYVPMSEIDKVRDHHPDEVIVYPDAGHGFFRDGSDAYHVDAAEDAWKRLTTFFAEHLH
jgi:carboxymethylenebutenolidase